MEYMNILEKLEDNKLYSINELSDVLKELGIPHNKATIKKYKEEGLLNMGQRPGSLRYVVLGSEIKRFVQGYLVEAGVL